MLLKDLEYSDIILSAENPTTRFFKGTPEKGLALARITDETLNGELDELLKLLRQTYSTHNSTLSLRVVFGGIAFRAAVYNDAAHGDIFFLRRLPEAVPNFRDLGLPTPVMSWLLLPENSKGLLLFSGAQASGKTTSASAFVAARLSMYGGHAITYEHPIEMPLAGKHGESGYCFQTEISSETELPAHVERSHRYSSPNIVFVGEIRTKHAASEVLRIALGSSQQLVVATIHGITLTAALDRLLSWTRESDGNAVACQNLAQTLIGVIQQELVFDANKQHLNVRDFLLLPFDTRTDVVRSKLRDGNLFLDDNIREQRNRIIYDGSL